MREYARDYRLAPATELESLAAEAEEERKRAKDDPECLLAVLRSVVSSRLQQCYFKHPTRENILRR